MSRNLLALVVALPCFCLLLARVGLFVQVRYSQEGLRNKSTGTGDAGAADTAPGQATQQTAYASHNPDRRIQKAIDCLLLEDDFAMVPLVEKAFRKQPELWPVLRREIAQLPPNAVSPETIQRKWSIAYGELLGKTGLHDEDLNSCCTILTWCIWYLHVTADPLLAAGAWNALGSAYRAIATILPARAADCGRAAFDSFQHTLTLYRQLTNTDAQVEQVNILCQMGQVRSFGIEEEIDRVACYLSRLHCFEQAQELCARNPAMAPHLLSSVYIGLGDTCKALYDELPGEVVWLKRARAAYGDLQALYQARDVQDEQLRQIIVERLNSIQLL